MALIATLDDVNLEPGYSLSLNDKPLPPHDLLTFVKNDERHFWAILESPALDPVRSNVFTLKFADTPMGLNMFKYRRSVLTWLIDSSHTDEFWLCQELDR